MKRNAANIIFIVIVILLMTALIAFYLYDVICVKTPFTKNLFRTIAILFVLLGTLVRLINGKGRKSLDFYEKAYADELGFAFKSKPLMRKKLLCAARLYDESNYRKAIDPNPSSAGKIRFGSCISKHDIISVPSYAEGIYHRSKSDIISKIYHTFREERISWCSE